MLRVVELRGIEPLTSAVRLRRHTFRPLPNLSPRPKKPTLWGSVFRSVLGFSAPYVYTCVYTPKQA